jgi:hypothetical protein
MSSLGGAEIVDARRSRLPLRFTTVAAKVGYLITGLIAVFLVSLLIAALVGFGNSVVTDVVNLVLSVAWWVVAVRSFRGAEEQVRPARAWWRVTARPTSGFVLGALLILSAVTTPFAPVAHVGTVWFIWTSAALNVIMAVAYLHSSVRLLLARRR